MDTINLCDNRLTDITLMPLAEKLQSFKSLTFLDLSYNKMDDSSESIMEFLRSPDCTLTTLLLNGEPLILLLYILMILFLLFSV